MRQYLKELRNLVRYNLRDDLVLLRFAVPAGVATLIFTLIFTCS
jgi:hypothetical protein